MDTDKYLSIDLNELHLECQRQAELYHQHATAAANARQRCEDAKTKLKLVECELARDIRNSPSAFGLPKVTDDGVKMTIPLQPEYQRAMDRYNRRKAALDTHEVNVEAVGQKKSMLEQLVKLRLADYFGDVSLPKEQREEVVEGRKRNTRSRGNRE